MLENGVDAMSPEGEHYTRKLSPKECSSLLTTMQGHMKNAEKLMAARPSRTLLDPAARIAELERFANSVPIDVEASPAAKDLN